MGQLNNARIDLKKLGQGNYLGMNSWYGFLV
jgi:hypothetical protein